MKTLYTLLLLTMLHTCNNDLENKDMNDLLLQQDSLVVSKIEMLTDSLSPATFYPGYASTGHQVLSKANVTEMVDILRDSSNYETDRSRNCVLNPAFGFRISGDSTNAVVFIGQGPCPKLTILDVNRNTERTIDLKDDNKVLPYFERMFLEKP